MTITKKNGKYYSRFQINGERYHYLCSGATSMKEAEKMESAFKYKLMQQQNGIIPREEKNVPLYKLKNIYLAYSKTNNRGYKNKIYYVRVLMDYFKETTPAQDITPAKIETFKQYLRTHRKLKNSSINRYTEVLSKMFNLGVDNKLLTENPVSKVETLLENNYTIRYLKIDEEPRLFTSIDKLHPYLRPIVTSALQSAMRKGEILYLKWSYINFDFGFIELLETKSGKSRQIPISKKLLEVLNSLPRISEYVFVNPKTMKPYVDIKKAWQAVLKDAKIENFRFHDLRHTAITRMVEKGIPLPVVQEIAGHTKIETTMRYNHTIPAQKLAAIEVLNSYT